MQQSQNFQILHIYGAMYFIIMVLDIKSAQAAQLMRYLLDERTYRLDGNSQDKSKLS